MLVDLIKERLVRAGLVTLIFGTGPLAIAMLVDPKANPIGLGILAMLSFWPGVLMVLVGVVTVVVRRLRGTAAPSRSADRTADRTAQLP